MRRVGVILILFGILLAGLAGVALYLLFPRTGEPVLEPSINIVMAFQAIPERTEIQPGQVGLGTWPQHIPTPSGAVARPEDAVGKLAQSPIYAGQPILQPMLVDKGDLRTTRSNASLILEKGMRAVALPVNTTSNVAEALQPGDRVDVIATFSLKPITDTTKPANPSEFVITQRLLQDVLVLQVGTWPRGVPVRSNPGGASEIVSTNTGSTNQAQPPAVVVTLQLNEQDVLVLRNMQATATDFTLALRAANDHALVNPTPVMLDYLQERFGFKPSTVGR